MVYIGMIYQYNKDDASGLIMLSDGGNKTFTSSDWTDELNSPSVGQKIAYENNEDRVSIRVATKDDVNISLSTQAEKKSVEKHLEHFTALGFKLIKDIQANEVRTLTLRSFAKLESEEVIIKETTTKITIVQTLNGKVVR
ncbi:hypothetical protein JHD49_02680 [Sulfurimonas sp. SAG-AH-194-C21]|nr:hypothetical protein [Sulfurimonas sp. SAG-AH-194-C21]MDF1882839.1 hypothetical protein [Sulfurimonas sp. SAG-AH-194-C21]